jgi:polyisoprenoid-binding protein YceI
VQALSRYATIAALISVATAASLSAADQPIDIRQSSVTIYVGKTGLLSTFADNHVISAPLASCAISETAPLHVALAVNATDLVVRDPDLDPGKREEVRARMLGPEVLDSARFPAITFESAQVDAVDANHWDVSGRLTIRGVSHVVAFKAHRDSGGHYRGEAHIRQRDFGIQPIRIAGGTISVKDDLRIEFDIAPAS